MTSAGLQGQNVGSARVEEDEAPLEGIVDPRGNIGGVSLMTSVWALPTNAAGIWRPQVLLFQVGPAAPPSALPELFSEVILFLFFFPGGFKCIRKNRIQWSPAVDRRPTPPLYREKT